MPSLTFTIGWKSTVPRVNVGEYRIPIPASERTSAPGDVHGTIAYVNRSPVCAEAQSGRVGLPLWATPGRSAVGGRHHPVVPVVGVPGDVQRRRPPEAVEVDVEVERRLHAEGVGPLDIGPDVPDPACPM